MYHFNKETAKDPGKDPALAGQDAFVDPFAVEGESDTAAAKDTSGGAQLQLDILYPKDGQTVTEMEAVITGQTMPDAIVFVVDKEAGVGSDGLFSGIVTLQKGANTIRVTAVRGDQTAEKIIILTYQPALELSILNATDNMEVTTAEYDLDIDVTEGTQFSVNGATGQSRVSLRPGPNIVTVKAWDVSGNTVERLLTLMYRTDISSALFISSPHNGAVVEKPEIAVSGTAAPGAVVTINNVDVAAGPSGAFNYILHIPDEAGQYSIHISVAAGNEETSVDRTVIYKPSKTPLSLTVTSPANGQKITRRIISLSGKTSPQATLTVNDKPVKISPTGVFSAELMLSETILEPMRLSSRQAMRKTR